MTVIKRWYDNLITREVAIGPLVTFRVVFGLVMFISVVRFMANGWVKAQYVSPTFHFKFFGFHWIPELPPAGYYIVFALLGLTALGIAFGALYRISTITFFLLFTYIELVDATYYLNHYYFVSIVAFLLVFVPANKQHSIDIRLGIIAPRATIPAVFQHLLMFQLGLVYFLAGIAKLNTDWLIHAMPLAIWLPAQSHLPVIGDWLTYASTAYVFSWAGALYDLTIPFLLLSKRWRGLAYLAVVGFHLLTWKFFQIGMFPFIMIGATLIFFSADFHLKLHRLVGLKETPGLEPRNYNLSPLMRPVLALLILVQLAVPFRYAIYPGNPFWTEQGYRFGWRVMLIEKAGFAQFKVKDKDGNQLWVENSDFLTLVQEKMLATQADFMLQYAAFLRAHYENQGIEVAAVTADVYVAFNGRPSQPFIDPNIDLSLIQDSWAHKDWIRPLALAQKG